MNLARAVRTLLPASASLFLLLFVLGITFAPEPRITSAQAQADPCSTANIAAAMKREAKSIGRAEARDLAAWCKKQADIERTASLAARPSDGKTVAKGALDLKTIPKSTAIICGKNACACWKGNVWNGCQHTDTLCAGALHCVSKVCGCQAK